MPKIEIRENKTLALSKALSRSIPIEEIGDLTNRANMMINWISAKGYNQVGPLILRSGRLSENEEESGCSLILQLNEFNVKADHSYKFEREIKVKNCLFARFDDEKDKIQFASMKLMLHAYENDLELTGETYTVFVKQDGDSVIADVFMPIKQAE
jgi:hypothetical protein